MSTVRVKQNDIGVTFTGTLTLTTAADWTGATVRWIIRNRTSLASYSGTGTISGSGTSATVSYTSVAGDLIEVGKFDQEWEVTFSNGHKITFPSGSYNFIEIKAELG
jgi:hypothetical protein